MKTGLVEPDNITILIQGPLKQGSLSNIENYLKFGKVFVKYWEGDENEDLLLSHPLVDRISTRKHKINTEPFQGTFRWQVDGIYFALKKIKTKYTIRTRSDESFSDLNPLINIFIKNTKRLIFGNIFWRKTLDHGHRHIGDHIFMAETKTIRNAYRFIKERQDKNQRPKKWEQDEVTENPEVSLYYNYIKSFRDENPNLSPEKALEVFDAVDIRSLGSYKISRSEPKGFWTNEEPMSEGFKKKLSIIENTKELEGKPI